MQDAAGDFEVYQYNPSLNAFVGNSMGAVGAPWVVDGIAGTDPPASGNAQLVQAMASMSGGTGASTSLNPSPGTPMAEQPLLTTPPHT